MSSKRILLSSDKTQAQMLLIFPYKNQLSVSKSGLIVKDFYFREKECHSYTDTVPKIARSEKSKSEPR